MTPWPERWQSTLSSTAVASSFRTRSSRRLGSAGRENRLHGLIRAQTEVKRNALALPQRAVTELVKLPGQQIRQLMLESIVNGVRAGSQRVERLASKTAHGCGQRNVENLNVFET